MTVWIGALAALVLTTQQVVADPAAEALLERARVIEARGEALSQIWPGYWPPDQPFILYLPETGAVFAGATSPEGARFRPGPLDDVRFTYVLDYPSGVDNTALLRLRTVDESLTILFHEQFHDYQHDGFRSLLSGPGATEFVDVTVIPDLEAFTIAVEQERRLLHAALGPVDAEARRALVQRYLAARARRLEPLPTAISNAESHREWTEGTAEYAALRATVVIEPEGPSVPERLRKELEKPLLEPGGSYVGDMFRARAYPVGASLAWLVDDLGVWNWRARVQRGEPLVVLLAEGAGDSPTPPPEPVDETLREEIRRQMTLPPDAVAEPVDAADFLSREPDWLVVRFEGPARRAMPMELSFGARSMTPLPGGVIALQQVTEVVAEFDGARIETHARPVMITDAVGPTMVVATVLHIALQPGERERIVAGQPLIELENLKLDLPADTVIEDIDGQRTVRVIYAP